MALVTALIAAALASGACFGLGWFGAETGRSKLAISMLWGFALCAGSALVIVGALLHRWLA